MSALRYDDAGKLVLRLTLGVLMLFHGVAKILNPGALGFIRDQLLASGLPGAIAYGVYVGEVVAPLLVILGVLSRIGALVIAGNMVFAIGLVHMGDIFARTQHGGWALELQGFFLFAAVAVALLGSGRIAFRPD